MLTLRALRKKYGEKFILLNCGIEHGWDKNEALKAIVFAKLSRIEGGVRKPHESESGESGKMRNGWRV